MAIAGSNTRKIGQIIRRIRTRNAEPIRVEELAPMANMSPSSFLQHFKAVTVTNFCRAAAIKAAVYLSPR
jgi:AraC-like DNA-binding protein